MSMKAMTSDDLGIKAARLFFVYSFLCNGSTPTKELPRDLVKLGILEKGVPKPKSRQKNLPTTFRNGLSAYIALDLPMAFCRLDHLTGFVVARGRQNDGFRVRIDPLLRLFSNGGSLTLKVVLDTKGTDADRKIRVDEVHRLHHLAPLVGNREEFQLHSLSSFKQKDCSLYELYEALMAKELDRWSKVEEQKTGKKREHHLLCKDHLDPSVKSPKMPWVITLLELNNEDALDAFCGDLMHYNLNEADLPYSATNPAEAKAQSILPYVPLIAPLIYRAPDFEHFIDPQKPNFTLEPAYYDSFKRLNSVNVEARIYVQMSRRSILCICDDRHKYPASYFLPALLDLCEVVHTRWHSLIILHKVLDDSLKDFSAPDSLTSPFLKGRGRKARPVPKLEEIIKLVGMATTCLEDPAIFTVSGDAMRNLHEELNLTFRLELLAQRASQKVHFLEQIYNHGLELGWSRELREPKAPLEW